MKTSFTVAGVEGVIEGPEGKNVPTLVMVHGWPDTARIWDAQVAYFKQYYRCVTFTLPGFEAGNAESKTGYTLDQVVNSIAAVADHASPDSPVYLMIHDWGSFYGYQYYQRHPERVSRLVIVDVGDAGSRAFKKTLSPKSAALILSYQLPLALAWKIGGRVGDRMARSVAKVLKAPASSDQIFASMGYPYFIQWTGGLGSFKGARFNVPECPTLFIYALRKPIMFHTQSWAEALAAKPGNQVLSFDTSHWVMVDAPERFNQTLYGWLEG